VDRLWTNDDLDYAMAVNGGAGVVEAYATVLLGWETILFDSLAGASHEQIEFPFSSCGVVFRRPMQT
jgi:hypothetical protein